MDYNLILKYMFFCHKQPERSFFYKGKQFPICARCTGILLGYILGIIYVLFFKSLGIILEFSLMIPLLIDGWGQYIGWFKSTNSRRLITGILAGIATICLFRLAIYFGLHSGRAFANFI